MRGITKEQFEDTINELKLLSYMKLNTAISGAVYRDMKEFNEVEFWIRYQATWEKYLWSYPN